MVRYNKHSLFGQEFLALAKGTSKHQLLPPFPFLKLQNRKIINTMKWQHPLTFR